MFTGCLANIFIPPYYPILNYNYMHFWRVEGAFSYKKNDTMINAYVGCAIDSTVRYMATSGGVGSYLLKYLFDKGEIHTAITFDYDNEIFKICPSSYL